MRTLPETVAYIIDCDMSERKFRKTRKLANPKGKTKRFQTYENAQKYRDQNCIPTSAIKTSDGCIFVELKDLLHHQASRLITATMETKMQSLKDEKNAKFVLYFEWGESKLYILCYFFTDVIFELQKIVIPVITS